MDSRFRSLLESGAFLIGAALIVSVLIGGQIGGGWATPGLDLTLDAQPSTELDIQPANKLIAHRLVRPSPTRRGVGVTLSARNATGAPLAVRLRTALTSRDYDQLVRVRVDSGGRVVFSGPLAELRQGASLGTLASHQTLSMHIEAWLPHGARGYQAQSARVPLTFDTEPASG